MSEMDAVNSPKMVNQKPHQIQLLFMGVCSFILCLFYLPSNSRKIICSFYNFYSATFISTCSLSQIHQKSIPKSTSGAS